MDGFEAVYGKVLCLTCEVAKIKQIKVYQYFKQAKMYLFLTKVNLAVALNGILKLFLIDGKSMDTLLNVYDLMQHHP